MKSVLLNTIFMSTAFERKLSTLEPKLANLSILRDCSIKSGNYFQKLLLKICKARLHHFTYFNHSQMFVKVPNSNVMTLAGANAAPPTRPL